MRLLVPVASRLLFGSAFALVAALAAVAHGAPGGDEGDDEDDSGTRTEREPCALGRGARAVLVTETERETCGSGGCGQTYTVRIEGAKGELWLGVQNELGDFAQRDPLEVRCDGRGVLVRTDGVADAPELRFRYDRASRGLRLTPETAAGVEANWRAAPVTDKAELARRKTLVALLEAVLPDSVSATDEAPSPAGVRQPLVDAARLVVARDEFNAGDWESAERDLGLVSPNASRRQELVAAVASARTRTRPLILSAQRRLGTTSKLPVTPLFPDAAPTLFWRGDELCVAQEDTVPPARMRCYAPAGHGWGSAMPLALPESSGQNLRSMSYAHVSRCEGLFVAQKRVPETGTACADGFGVDADQLVGVVERDAMVLLGSSPKMSGLSVNRGPDRDQSLTAVEASAVIRSSAGSRVLGDGCCFLAPDHRVGLLNGNDEQRWSVLPEPPPGERWSGGELVSPNQRWVVAGSVAGSGGKTTLWLFRVQRTTGR